MAQVEERLAAAAPAQAPTAPLALPPPVESPPLPARLSEESSNDSSDGRKKEKKGKKKKKREKRERRERERSQGLGGGVQASLGGIKEEGEGEVVVDEGNEGNGDREEGEGVEVVDPPPPCPPPPLPRWLLKALGAQSVAVFFVSVGNRRRGQGDACPAHPAGLASL